MAKAKAKKKAKKKTAKRKPRRTSAREKTITVSGVKYVRASDAKKKKK